MIELKEKVAERFPQLGLVDAPQNHIKTLIRNWFQTDKVYCISYRGDGYTSWFLVYLPETDMVSIVRVWGVGYPANLSQEASFYLREDTGYKDLLQCLNLAHEIFTSVVAKIIK